MTRHQISLSHRWEAGLVLASLALSLPALLAGYWWDDHFFSSALIDLDAPFGSYHFVEALRQADLMPWWTSPDLRLAFFRPLSSAALHLDFGVLGSPLLAHLHSALWFVALLLGGFGIYRRWLQPRSARWAMVIFALGSCHAFTAGWIAARHAVMGGALAVWALFFYLRARRGGGRGDAVISLALFVLGLLSSEGALAAAALVVAHEVAGARDSWGARLRAAAPTVGIALIYVVAYKAAGLGPHGSASYVDPLAQPGAYALGAAPKTVAILGTLVFGVPTTWSAMPGLERIPLLAGGVGLLLLVVGLALCRRRRCLEPESGWLALGALLGLLPALTTLPQGRSVVLSAVAFAAVAGGVVSGLLAVRRLAPRVCAVLLIVGLCVTSPLLRLALGAFIYTDSKAQAAFGRGSRLDCARGARVYQLNGAPMSAFFSPVVIARHRGAFFRGWHQLTETDGDVEVRRTGETTLTIDGGGRPLVSRAILELLRADPDGLVAGKVVAAEHMRVRVLAQGPSRIEVTIPALEDRSRTCLVMHSFDEGILRRMTLPPQGQAATLRYQRPGL
jgi:hypothetical protein